MLALSDVGLFETPWTVAHQAPPSMEFSRRVYQSGLPFPSPGDLPNQGIEPGSPALWADALPSEAAGKYMETLYVRPVLGERSRKEKKSKSLNCPHHRRGGSLMETKGEADGLW